METVTVINRAGLASVRPSESYWNALLGNPDMIQRGYAVVAFSPVAFRQMGTNVTYVQVDGELFQTVIAN